MLKFEIILTCLLALMKVFVGVDISWLWVFSPLWLPPLLVAGMVVSAASVAVVVAVLDNLMRLYRNGKSN